MSNEGETSYDYLLKFIIVGDAAVGKSNLVSNYFDGQFTSEYESTTGYELRNKKVQIRNTTFRVLIYDTAGRESSIPLPKPFYKNKSCALVIYDISNRASFNNVSTWIEKCTNESSKTIFVLVGNKSDLADKRQVSIEEGQELAEKYEMKFYETSAKTGENVNEIFYDSMEEIANKLDQNFYDLEDDNCEIKKGNKK